MTTALPPRARTEARPAGQPPEAAADRPRAAVRTLRRIAAGGLFAAVVAAVLGPQLTGTNWNLFGQVDGAWLELAALLEAASLAAYAALTRAVLPRTGRPGYLRILGIDLSTMAVSHVVPAGSAVGLGLGFRLLTAEGVRGSAAVFTQATQALGSAVVLNVLLWIALIWSIPLHGISSVYGVVALVGVMLMTAAAVLFLLVLRGRDRIAGGLARALGRLPRLSPEAVHAGVLAGIDHLRVFTRDRRLLGAAGVLAAANWLLDAAALWACVRAFGHTLGPDGAFVPYGIAAVVAALPVTPAGLGIVEASLIPSLVAFGTPHGVALLGVLAWRALAYLLPIPLGGLSYLLLQRTPSRASYRRGRAPERAAPAGVGRRAFGHGHGPAGRGRREAAHPRRGR